MSGFEDRKEYAKGQLTEEGVRDVVDTMKEWFEQAQTSDPTDYNAMTLSTVGEDGHPNGRVVLLRSLEEVNGFPAITFYTNYQSRKGRELEGHPHAAATFFWREWERQLRIRGRVHRMSDEASDRYFASRPRESRVGAWASQQSQNVQGRAALERQWAEFDERFGEEVPRPPHWGGYFLIAEEVEFWQGRPGRMHDRLWARRSDDGWRLERLQP